MFESQQEELLTGPSRVEASPPERLSRSAECQRTEDANRDRFVSYFLDSQAHLYYYIASLLTNRCDADEVFQHTAMVLWREHEKIQDASGFINFARTIAFNEIRNMRRRHKRQPALLSGELLENLNARWPDRENCDEREEVLACCLDKLDAARRELIEQYYHGERGRKEIAKSLGLTPEALRMRIIRVRRQLLDCVSRRARLEQRA